MVRLTKLIVGIALLLGSISANAITLNFTHSVGESSTSMTASVASLNIVQVGSDVRFDLTSNTSSLLGGGAYISQFLFSSTGSVAESDFTALPGQTISDFNVGSTTDAAYTFGLELEFPTSNGPGSDRFLSGDTASWTIANASVGDFLNPVSRTGDGGSIDAVAMIHIQNITGGDSIKYVAPVPEPGVLAMMAMGLVVIGARTMRKKH